MAGNGLAMSPGFKLFISSIGFISDAYNLIVINIVKQMMGATGGPGSQFHDLNEEWAPFLAMSAPLGAILGQLLFGALADRIGRRVIFITTISCVIVGSFGSATVVEAEHFNCYLQLSLWLFLVGFGVGGEYPLSATISSEASSNEKRGRNVALVFSMQGVGNILAGLVSYLAIVGLFDNGSTVQQQLAWRICLAFGGLPGLLTVYWRWKMEESHIFSEAHEHHQQEESAAASGDDALTESSLLNRALHEVGQYLDTLYKFRWVLAGTAVSWFIFDVTYYANGQFSGSIIEAFGFGSGLGGAALANVVIGFIGLPGYFLGAFTVDYFGRRQLQIWGFVALAGVYLALALLLERVGGGGFLFLYGLTFLASNWGPNTTTFVIPAESFPTWARATCHGISAASGKFGAVVGDQTLGRLAAHLEDRQDGKSGLVPILLLCAAIGVAGAVWSFFFTVDRSGASLEELDAVPTGHAPLSTRSDSDGDEEALGDGGRVGASDSHAVRAGAAAQPL